MAIGTRRLRVDGVSGSKLAFGALRATRLVIPSAEPTGAISLGLERHADAESLNHRTTELLCIGIKAILETSYFSVALVQGLGIKETKIAMILRSITTTV